MRPVEFAPEQIVEAGQALQASGRNVTGFALRQKVGGGNPNRLKQVWDEHQASQSVAQVEPVAELPVEVAEQLKIVTGALTERLAALAVDLNDKAVKASERRVSEVVRAAGEQREQAERELADASQTVEDLERQLDEAQERIELLQQQLTDSGTVQQEQKVAIAHLQERLAAAEKAAREAAVDHGKREAELKAQLDDTRRAEQAAREREAQAVGAMSLAEKQHLEDAEVAQRLRIELRETADKLATAAAQLATQGEQVTQAKVELAAAREESKAAARVASEATGREQAAQAQIKALQDALKPQAKPAKPATKKPAAPTKEK